MKGLRVAGISIFLIISGCGSEKPPALEPLAPGPYGVGVRTLTFYDTSRGIEPYMGFPSEASRTLVVEVWYPSVEGSEGKTARNGTPDLRGAPYPLIVFAHGAMSFRTQSSFLCTHLASYGYVVVSPDFPLSSIKRFIGMNPQDVVNQPKDVSFIIDRVIELSRNSQSFLSGMIDENKIGMTGHSLGGLTTLLITFYPGLYDERIKASAPISPFACFLERDSINSRSVPTLLIGGDRDKFVNVERNIYPIYSYLNSPKYLLVLKGGTHLGSLDFNISETFAYSLFGGVMQGMKDVTGLEEEFFQFLATFGNPEGCGDLYTEYLSPITNVSFFPSPEEMDPEVQRTYEKLFITAFFNLYLKNETKWEKYLTEKYANQFDDVVLKRN